MYMKYYPNLLININNNVKYLPSNSLSQFPQLHLLFDALPSPWMFLFCVSESIMIQLGQKKVTTER